MRMSLASAAFLAIAAGDTVQAQTAPSATSNPPAVDAKAIPDASGPNAHGAVGQTLESGANSFTETQVRERFGRMGFGEVKDLRKDDTGIWRGTAQHAGKSVSIGLDYKGNVAAQ